MRKKFISKVGVMLLVMLLTLVPKTMSFADYCSICNGECTQECWYCDTCGNYIVGLDEPCDCDNSCIICKELIENCTCNRCKQCGKESSDCTCCEQCGKTDYDCDCCEHCGEVAVYCNCCDTCGEDKKFCICCKRCDEPVYSCFCERCQFCNKLTDDCNCCQKCGLDKMYCKCCKYCGKDQDECKCYCGTCGNFKATHCTCTCEVCHKLKEECNHYCSICGELRKNCSRYCRHCSELKEDCDCSICAVCKKPEENCSCEKCGDCQSSVNIDIIDSTCTSEGLKTTKCLNCSNVSTQIIPKKPCRLNSGLILTPPSCTDDPIRCHLCNRVGPRGQHHYVRNSLTGYMICDLCGQYSHSNNYPLVNPNNYPILNPKPIYD